MKTSEIIIIIALVFFLFMQYQKPITTTNVPVDTQAAIPTASGCAVTENTVTFNNNDLYAQGTTVTQGNLILSSNGNKENIAIAAGGTKIYSPSLSYKVLLGNKTTGLLGTDYYPQYIEGTFKCSGSEILQGLLPKAVNMTQSLSFSWWNDAEAINTAQALGASETKYVRIRFAAPDNACFGNPYAEKMGGKNVMCFSYNTTSISYVELINAESANKPKSLQLNKTSYTDCYKFPVICDNGEYKGRMMIKATATEPIADGSNISISLHDVTFDYNADTLDLIIGVEDEPNTMNDIGVKDLNTNGYYAYSISIT